jgi:hypothetical protein
MHSHLVAELSFVQQIEETTLTAWNEAFGEIHTVFSAVFGIWQWMESLAIEMPLT